MTEGTDSGKQIAQAAIELVLFIQANCIPAAIIIIANVMPMNSPIGKRWPIVQSPQL